MPPAAGRQVLVADPQLTLPWAEVETAALVPPATPRCSVTASSSPQTRHGTPRARRSSCSLYCPAAHRRHPWSTCPATPLLHRAQPTPRYGWPARRARAGTPAGPPWPASLTAPPTSGVPLGGARRSGLREDGGLPPPCHRRRPGPAGRRACRPIVGAHPTSHAPTHLRHPLRHEATRPDLHHWAVATCVVCHAHSERIGRTVMACGTTDFMQAPLSGESGLSGADPVGGRLLT